MATSKLAMLNRACWASTTWVKMVALTVTTTLSLVITSWRSPGRGSPHIDTLEGLDERLDDHQPGLVLAVLAEVSPPDLALLDDVDHLAQRQEHYDPTRPTTTRPNTLRR
jgi:hypothetical protein